jgi:hypothetical protein
VNNDARQKNEKQVEAQVAEGHSALGEGEAQAPMEADDREDGATTPNQSLTPVVGAGFG